MGINIKEDRNLRLNASVPYETATFSRRFHNRILFVIILLFFFCSTTVFAASSSSSYKISASSLSGGGGGVSSASYKLANLFTDLSLGYRVSSGYSLGEGFNRSNYIGATVFAPIITGITPSSGSSGAVIEVTNLAGANFSSGAIVKLTKSGATDIQGTNVVVVSGTKITCKFDLTGAVSGYWNVEVLNSDGRSGSLPSAFNVGYVAPTVTSITPVKGRNNEYVTITDLAGTNFRNGIKVSLTKTGELDITGENIIVGSTSKITCLFNLTGKSSGLWNVVVLNDDNQSGTLTSGFKIETLNLEVLSPVKSSKTVFNPSSTALNSSGPAVLEYQLSKDADVTVFIFNMRGEKVWEYKASAGTSGGSAGINQVSWDGITAFRAYASAGVYFVHVTTIENGAIKTISKTKIAVVK